MTGSCHLDRVSDVEIDVECQIFVVVVFFNCSQVLQFGAHSRDHFLCFLLLSDLIFLSAEKIKTNIQN